MKETQKTTSKNTASTAPPRSSSKSPGLPLPQRNWAATAILLSIGTTIVDMNIVNLALPTISTQLHISASSSIWIINAYFITLIAFILPLSAVAESIGFKRMFRGGIVIFITGAIFTILASNLNNLILGRVIQGIGSATLMSIVGATMRYIYPPKKLAIGISINAMVVGVCSVLSPPLGAFILSFAAWQWVFCFTVPFCILALFFSRFLPEIPTVKKTLDYLSALLNMLTFGCLICGFDLVLNQPYIAIGLFGISLLCGVLLYIRSSTQKIPLFPVDLLHIPTFKYALIVSSLLFSGSMMATVSLPFFYQFKLGLPVSTVGILFIAWPIGSTLMARPAAYLSSHYAGSILAAIGSCLMFLGLLVVVLLPTHIWPGFYMLALFVSGMGFGFVQTPNNKAILLSPPINRSGATSGMQATTRIFGQSMGAALVSLCFYTWPVNGTVYALYLSLLIVFSSAIINIIRYFRGMDIDIL